MSWSRFSTFSPGKWVLAGEHSVLKGGVALALPHPEMGLELEFTPDSTCLGLRVLPDAAQAFVDEVIERAKVSRESLGESFVPPQGVLRIQSTIPIGAGLGSSAALCVALTRWLSEPLGLLDDLQQVEFATGLENRFHGKSSGMDIAVIAAAQPIAFTMSQGMTRLQFERVPKFSFHDTALRCRTHECVAKVEEFRKKQPEFSQEIDQKMSQSSKQALQGLRSYHQGHKALGLSQLKEAMEMARECFYAWDLVPVEAKKIEESLLRQGALAVKLTGAGGGGMVVALWPEG